MRTTLAPRLESTPLRARRVVGRLGAGHLGRTWTRFASGHHREQFEHGIQEWLRIGFLAARLCGTPGPP